MRIDVADSARAAVLRGRGELVVVAGGTSDDRMGLLAFDAGDGTEAWRTEVPVEGEVFELSVEGDELIVQSTTTYDPQHDAVLVVLDPLTGACKSHSKVDIGPIFGGWPDVDEIRAAALARARETRIVAPGEEHRRTDAPQRRRGPRLGRRALGGADRRVVGARDLEPRARRRVIGSARCRVSARIRGYLLDFSTSARGSGARWAVSQPLVAKTRSAMP